MSRKCPSKHTTNTSLNERDLTGNRDRGEGARVYLAPPCLVLIEATDLPKLEDRRLVELLQDLSRDLLSAYSQESRNPPTYLSSDGHLFKLWVSQYARYLVRSVVISALNAELITASSKLHVRVEVWITRTFATSNQNLITRALSMGSSGVTIVQMIQALYRCSKSPKSLLSLKVCSLL